MYLLGQSMTKAVFSMFFFRAFNLSIKLYFKTVTLMFLVRLTPRYLTLFFEMLKWVEVTNVGSKSAVIAFLPVDAVS